MKQMFTTIIVQVLENVETVPMKVRTIHQIHWKKSSSTTSKRSSGKIEKEFVILDETEGRNEVVSENEEETADNEDFL